MMTESNKIVKLSLGSLRGLPRIEPARWIRGTRMMRAKHIFAKHVGCLVQRKFSGENKHDAQLREPLFDHVEPVLQTEVGSLVRLWNRFATFLSLMR
jgi:hypothetical protein